jgi:hypothetical protein
MTADGGASGPRKTGMHDGDLRIGGAPVAQLLAAQFPEVARLACRACPSTGSVCAPSSASATT